MNKGVKLSASISLYLWTFQNTYPFNSVQFLYLNIRLLTPTKTESLARKCEAFFIGCEPGPPEWADKRKRPGWAKRNKACCFEFPHPKEHKPQASNLLTPTIQKRNQHINNWLRFFIIENGPHMAHMWTDSHQFIKANHNSRSRTSSE